MPAVFVGWCLAEAWHGFDAYSQIENQDISMQLEASHLDGLG